MADDPKVHDINEDALAEVYGSAEEQAQAEDVQREMLAAFHGAFSTEQGQECLQWMKRLWGGFTFDPDNARQDAFNQGQRHVVETIEQFLKQIDEGEA